MTDIDQIIERLEKATSGDFELDSLIAQCVFGAKPCGVNGCTEIHDDRNFTGSVDMALTLVPEGWGLSGLSNCMLDPKYSDIRATGWHATLAKIDGKFMSSADFRRAPTASATTAPLAICIVSLRTRSRTGEG